MPLRGAKAHTDRLKYLASPAVEKLVTQALFVGAETITVEAQLSITRGAASGKNHVPSKPGEPPNQDTGVLSSNIEAARFGRLKAKITSSAPYAAALEFGTSKMAARPYMRPARDKKKAEVRNIVAKTIKVAVRNSRS